MCVCDHHTMSWQSRKNIEGKSSSRGGGTTTSKIRKRGCSSSSSSSLVQRYRFKRAILVGKRGGGGGGGGGGSSTPVPAWKTSTKSPSLAMPAPEQSKGSLNSHQCGVKAKEVSVSARKLAATLWEINKVPSPKDKQILSDPSYSPISEKMDRSRGNIIARRRRTSVGSQSHMLQVSDCNVGAMDTNLISNDGMMEIEALCSRGKHHNGCITGIKTRLKDVSGGLTASKELLKVLNRVWGLQEQHSSGISLISAIRAEVDRARVQVDQLIKDQRSNHSEIEYLMKHFAEEKAAWRRKERERIREAIACIAEELEVEKKLRRQTERLNKKLGKDLAETKACLSNAMKELESEKRAKDIMEQVCDELARGIGEDRAEFEELKRESVKVREEMEKEREMLQLADVLREERVQMKLSEAKYHFEEKNAAVERLRNELEAYLRTKKGEENGDMSPNFERIKELEAYLKKIQFGSCENGVTGENERELVNGEEHDGDNDSADSDLHSIELNMDNGSRNCKWSYAYDDQDDPKRVSVDKVFKGRKSIEKIQWGSICFGRGSSNMEQSFHEHSGGIDRERLAEILSQTETQDHADEIKRYRSIKNLRDHILSGSKMISLQSFGSPTRQWGQSLPVQDPGSAGRKSQGDDLRKQDVNGGCQQVRKSNSFC